MANICTFDMVIKGKDKESITNFVNALHQEGDVWIGRGAYGDVDFNSDTKATFYGECKWSMLSALVLDAQSMNEQKEHNGEGIWSWNEESQQKEYLTIFEACKKFNVNFVAYSEEPGCCFQEYFKYENGEITQECVDAIWEYFEDEEEREAFIKEHPELADKCDDYECIVEGGFDEMNFDLEEVI